MASEKNYKKSGIWEHFTKLPCGKLTQCNLCEKQYVFGNGTGNFWNHLESVHKIKRKTSKVQEAVNAAEKRLQQPTISSKLKELKKYEKTDPKHQDITRTLAKLFIVEMMPLHKVEKKCWKMFVHQLDSR